MSTIQKLKEDGRKSYDQMQKNLSWQTSRSDEEIKADQSLYDMFGNDDPEEYRASARREQDKLDRQGREAYAKEYAENQIKNMIA